VSAERWSSNPSVTLCVFARAWMTLLTYATVGCSTHGANGQTSPKLAALYGAPIGPLGGLIGLGGVEFRLPVLAGVFGYKARRAVALNLAISLITVVSALLITACLPVLSQHVYSIGATRETSLSNSFSLGRFHVPGANGG
jgi:uncharacterized membrane protein YfcA